MAIDPVGLGEGSALPEPHPDRVATLHLLCGLPGAGKTTLARRLEEQHAALRLCPDDWIAALLASPSDAAERDRLRAPVEALQSQVALRTLALGVNVILENGFWSRAERDWYRAQAQSVGAHVILHYLAAEREELWARLEQRNAALPPGTFAVSRAELDLWWSWFEPPTPDEFERPAS